MPSRVAADIGLFTIFEHIHHTFSKQCSWNRKRTMLKRGAIHIINPWLWIWPENVVYWFMKRFKQVLCHFLPSSPFQNDACLFLGGSIKWGSCFYQIQKETTTQRSCVINTHTIIFIHACIHLYIHTCIYIQTLSNCILSNQRNEWGKSLCFQRFLSC